MAFLIEDVEYTKGTDRNPKAMGYIEGYTSNTVGSTFLRINCKSEFDNEARDWYLRLFREIPKDVCDIDKFSSKHYLRERQIGDCVGEGVRLNRKQVCTLIVELIKWLVRGN